jgi:hypothetical protein
VRRSALVLVALLLAGCGGHSGQPKPKDEVVEGPLGKGGYQTWIFRPHEYPKAAKPDAILAVYPAAHAPFDFPVDYRQVDRRSRIRILVGDRDRVVGRVGARQLIGELRDAGFPVRRIEFRQVRSHGHFSATHASVFQSGKDAQQAYRAEADDLVKQVTG